MLAFYITFLVIHLLAFSVSSVNKPIQYLHRLRNVDFPAAPKTQGTEILTKPLGGICPSNCEKSGFAIGQSFSGLGDYCTGMRTLVQTPTPR